MKALLVVLGLISLSILASASREELIACYDGFKRGDMEAALPCFSHPNLVVDFTSVSPRHPLYGVFKGPEQFKRWLGIHSDLWTWQPDAYQFEVLGYDDRLALVAINFSLESKKTGKHTVIHGWHRITLEGGKPVRTEIHVSNEAEMLALDSTPEEEFVNALLQHYSEGLTHAPIAADAVILVSGPSETSLAQPQNISAAQFAALLDNHFTWSIITATAGEVLAELNFHKLSLHLPAGKYSVHDAKAFATFQIAKPAPPAEPVVEEPAITEPLAAEPEPAHCVGESCEQAAPEAEVAAPEEPAQEEEEEAEAEAETEAVEEVEPLPAALQAFEVTGAKIHFVTGDWAKAEKKKEKKDAKHAEKAAKKAAKELAKEEKAKHKAEAAAAAAEAVAAGETVTGETAAESTILAEEVAAAKLAKKAEKEKEKALKKKEKEEKKYKKYAEKDDEDEDDEEF